MQDGWKAVQDASRLLARQISTLDENEALSLVGEVWAELLSKKGPHAFEGVQNPVGYLAQAGKNRWLRENRHHDKLVLEERIEEFGGADAAQHSLETRDAETQLQEAIQALLKQTAPPLERATKIARLLCTERGYSEKIFRDAMELGNATAKKRTPGKQRYPPAAREIAGIVAVVLKSRQRR